MPNTGERREITRRVNAKEAETVQESKQLVSRTRQLTASSDTRTKARSAKVKKQRSPQGRKKI
jgi:hypothetical protein